VRRSARRTPVSAGASHLDLSPYLLSTSPHLCTRRPVGHYEHTNAFPLLCMYVCTYLPNGLQTFTQSVGCVYVQSLFETHVHPLRYEVRTYIHEASVHEMCKGCGDAHRLRANRVLRFPPRLIAEGCMYVCTCVHACTL
jgi:hypothetical protein